MKLTQGQFMAYQGKYGRAATERVHARIDALCEEECRKTKAPVTVYDPKGNAIYTVIPVQFFCGMYRSAPRWQGTERYEMTECGADGIVVVDKEEYEAEGFSIPCPECRSEIYRIEGHFSPVV